MGDFLIVRTNGSKNLIGRGAIILEEIPNSTYFASYLIRFRLVSSFTLLQWVSHIWHSPAVRSEVELLASTSAGQYNINLVKLNSILIPIPPEEEMVELNLKLINALDKEARISTITKVISDRITLLNQSILDKSFKGQLVPQDPADEPAYKLLEKIKQEKSVLGKEKKVSIRRKKGEGKKEPIKVKKKQSQQSLTKVLQRHPSGLSTEALFQNAGFDKDSVEQFYAELKIEVAQGNIIEDRPDNEQVILRLRAA